MTFWHSYWCVTVVHDRVPSPVSEKTVEREGGVCPGEDVCLRVDVVRPGGAVRSIDCPAALA